LFFLLVSNFVIRDADDDEEEKLKRLSTVESWLIVVDRRVAHIVTNFWSLDDFVS
jgi:hypothetical protein